METSEQPEVVPESVEDLIQSEAKKKEQEMAATIWPEYCNPSYVMPDNIEVKITRPGNESYYFTVQIVKAIGAKLYLGGYRNKMTGLLYHHASTQTPTEVIKQTKDYSNLRTRDTQTNSTRTLSIQPYRECGTQMERIDLRIDNKRDRVIVSKPYFTAEKLLIKKKLCLIEIQRAWRGYQARCLARQIRQRNLEYQKKIEEDK